MLKCKFVVVVVGVMMCAHVFVFCRLTLSAWCQHLIIGTHCSTFMPNTRKNNYKSVYYIVRMSLRVYSHRDISVVFCIVHIVCIVLHMFVFSDVFH